MAKAKIKRKYSGIGGQAVIEGVMMRNNDKYAVAVRKPDKEIEVKVTDCKNIVNKKVTRIPFVRGVFNFVDSLVIGLKTLMFSASFYEEEEVKPTKTDKAMEKVFKDKATDVVMYITMALSIVFAIALFMILPYFISNLLKDVIESDTLMAVIEGVIRISIFIGYVLLITLMDDIKRLFQYHGAEHKCINCIERGKVLNVTNVRKSSKQHKRCGTSFLLIVMIVSIIFFIFIRTPNPWLRVLLRVALLPVVAGVSYELIRLAGRFDNPVVNILSAPGMLLQKLTTREPDDEMIEVAIKSVEAVFDWKEYLHKHGYISKEEYASLKAKEDFEFVEADK
ncbi:MAG: DUF1385 domain-containing protein [Lachnospiraceae bacterium]|nr:DUF1385 domain-containing protein [Lachnospiraceae bacterium]